MRHLRWSSLIVSLGLAGGIAAAAGCFQPTQAKESNGGGVFRGGAGSTGDGGTDGGPGAAGCFLAPEVAYDAEPELTALTTADLDGDGRFEVLAAGGTVLRVWRPAPDAGLAATESYTTAGATVALAVGHFDDDTYWDVSVVNADPQSSTQVFPGLANSTFSTPPLLGPGRGFVKQAVSADFDGDGRPDWALAADNTLSGEVYVLLDTLPATPFSSNYQLDATRRRAGITTNDFTRDGLLDLAASDPVLGQVAVYQGLGDGGFTAIATVDAGLVPRTLISGDFNGDGFGDLVAASPDDFSLAFIAGTADAGVFAPYQRVASATGQPVGLARAGEGVLTAEVNPNGLGEYLLDPDAGVMTAVGTIAISGPPRAVALADLDGDGDLDVVALRDGGVSVFRVDCQ